MSLIEYILSDTIMPGLYNPVLGYADVLSFVGERIIPENEGFVRTNVFQPSQKALEQLVVIMNVGVEQLVVLFGVPDICDFITTKVVKGRIEVLIDRRNKATDLIVCLVSVWPYIELCLWSLQIWPADHQIFVPHSPFWHDQILH